jgi:hypothetical protein
MPRSKGVKREIAMLLNSMPHADVARMSKRTEHQSSPIVATPAPTIASGWSTSPPSSLQPRRLHRSHQHEEHNPEAQISDDDDDDEYTPSEEDDSQEDEEDEEATEKEVDTPMGGVSFDDVSSLTPDNPAVAEEDTKPAASQFSAGDNILLPWHETKASYEAFPCPKCLGKGNNNPNDEEESNPLWKESLLAEAYSHGALSDIVITCQVCSYETVVCATIVKDDSNTIDEESSARRSMRRGTGSSAKYKAHESKFKAYPINYNMVLLAHVLGCSTDAIGTIFAFLGMAPSKGGNAKWKQLEDVVGDAEQHTAAVVCDENRADAIVAYQEKAKEQYTNWVATQEGRQSPQQTKVAKMQEFLNLKDGRVGLSVGMDGAWQRRAIGFGNGNSMSGHNFCVDLNTKRIINFIVYSKRCTTCTRYTKLGTPAPIHRCSQNFEGSSKSMEADASVQHKVDLETNATGVFIHTLCTDDDSSVRANTKYSFDDLARRDYPDYHGRNKHITDWPYTETTVNGKTTRTYAKDTGHLPLQCYPIDRYITDKNHRVRCIGKFLFSKELQSKAKCTPMGKMSKEEALKLKKYAGYYLKQDTNQQLPFDEFVRRAPCMYLHHFNDHSLCNVQWCKILQSQRSDGIQPTVIPVGYMKRFRHKETDKKLLDKLQDLYAPYLKSESLWQCYHAHDTNKNESLNRKCTAVAPKDRYLSGTMSLKDRISLVVSTDSVGYVEGFQRIMQLLGLDLELAAPVLMEWCRRVDRRQIKAGVWRQRPEVKRRRVAAINEAIKAYTIGDKAAAKQGKIYESGSAIDINACIDSIVGNDDDEADPRLVVDPLVVDQTGVL